MANQLIYKDIGIEDEPQYGASVAGTARRIHVRTVGINIDPNKQIVEQTTQSPLGADQIQRMMNTGEGDLTMYATPKVIHEAMELGFGNTATESAVGTSAVMYSYLPCTNGQPLSKTVNVDRGNSQEKLSGVIGRGFTIRGSDNKIEIVVPTYASDRASGTSMADGVGEQTGPLTFADVNIIKYQGATTNAGVTQLVKNWEVTWMNGFQPVHMNGSRNYQKVDGARPNASLNYTKYHENSNDIDSVHGCSTHWVRIMATLPSCQGLVAGVTPHYLVIDIGNIPLTQNIRPYEQAQMAIEEIRGNFGLYNANLGSQIRVQLTTDAGL